MFATKPMMGWNSQFIFGEAVSEQLILETADAMIEKGLLRAGYDTVILGDGWSSMTRDESGTLAPDEARFPHGLGYLAKKLHETGMKLGVSISIGPDTVSGRPGSLDHEYTDACFLAENEIDLVICDTVSQPSNTEKWTLWNRIRMALNATGRNILLSIFTSDDTQAGQWARKIGAEQYGNLHGSDTCFQDILNRFQVKKQYMNLSAPGCSFDMGILPCGYPEQDPIESATFFKLWCMLSAPLILGCDIRHLTPDICQMLTNPTLISIHQDAECRPPIHLTSLRHDDMPSMMKHLENGNYAFSITSVRDQTNIYVYVLLPDMGFPADGHYGFQLLDAESGEEIGTFTDSITIPSMEPKQTRVFRGRIVKLR